MCFSNLLKQVFVTYEMASTMANPIIMEQAAWSSLKSGSPQMQ